jgi:hypothetical protein
VPRAKAGHMTAPFQCVKSTEKALASRAVPHMGARSRSQRVKGRILVRPINRAIFAVAANEIG